MTINERRCECCAELADPTQTSAHYARVLFLCTLHGQRFHACERQWKSATETRVLLAQISLWVRVQRTGAAANDLRTPRAA